LRAAGIRFSFECFTTTLPMNDAFVECGYQDQFIRLLVENFPNNAEHGRVDVTGDQACVFEPLNPDECIQPWA